MHRVEIMRPGRFTASSGNEVAFAEDTLRLIAVSYDAAKAPAPVVIGHPKTNEPAFGWVKGMDFAEGTLGAYIGDLDPSFAEAVKAKRYQKVSASLFSPTAPANPRPGVFYLRHVGFLGAKAPAVPGLKPVSFAADDEGALDFAHDADAFGVTDGAASVTGRTLARLADLEARERQHAARAAVEFCDGLVKQGQLPNGLRELTIALLTHSPEEVVGFGEGEAAQRLPQGEALRRLLSALPPMVHFGEIAKPDGVYGEDPAPLEPPPGYAVDPAGVDLARRANAIAAAKGIAFDQAVRLASRGG
jgi:hypothetical protein